MSEWNTPASEIMSPNPLTAQEDATVEEVLKILLNAKITGMPVVNAQGKMVGIVSEFDILKQLAENKTFSPKEFSRKIQFTPTTVGALDSTPLKDIVDQFVGSKYRRVPILDADGKLVGIITRRDLMRVFYYRAKVK